MGKPDPDKKDFIYLKCVGGGEVPPAVLAPKCGPIGMPPKKVGDDIRNATKKDWEGIKVPVEVMVQNRQVTVTVVPSAASLILKALNEPVRDRKKDKDIKHDGNLTIKQIVEISKTMEEAGKSLAKTFKGTVKQILGTCFSIGCTVEGKSPKAVQKEVESGAINLE